MIKNNAGTKVTPKEYIKEVLAGCLLKVIAEETERVTNDKDFTERERPLVLAQLEKLSQRMLKIAGRAGAKPDFVE